MAKNVNELDFDLVKQNIIADLSSQTEFQDYNFAGSGMNVLIDALTYATVYMGVYGNMTFNEMSLVTALLRSSVTSKAAELAYVPTQINASRAELFISIDLSAEGSPPATLIVPKGTSFSATNEYGDGFVFITLSDFTLTNNGSDTLEGQITAYEGTVTSDEWTYDSNSGERFVLTNEMVDTAQMTVTVKENASSTSVVEWLNWENIVNIEATTTAYFFRETIEEKVEVYFGNGVIGKALEDGNVITVEYLVPSGKGANNIDKFSLQSGFSGYNASDYTVTTVTGSTEGVDRESIAQIKHNAPLYYQTQNRTVTENDYTSILLKQFSYIQAISVWGGEENDPPYYGRVMIAIKPVGASELTDVAKSDILTHLDATKITGIVPQLVDPEYTYIDLNAYVKYNAHLTTLTPEDIKVIVDQAIDDHFTNNLYAFNATLKYSELVADIDDSDNSIFSNFVELQLRNDFTPAINSSFTYRIIFNNEIEPSTVSLSWTNASSQAMQVKDDGEGVLYLYQDGELQSGTAGTVDYTNGEVVLVNFNPVLAAPTDISVTANPATYDIETVKNNILLKGNVLVNVERVIV
jgi:hypothetical protein